MITIEEILNSEVRALSWRQPYAELMLHGKIETRGWATKYRGLVLICASKHEYNYDEITAITGKNALYEIIHFFKLSPLPVKFLNGHAIAIARLVDCRPMTAEDEFWTVVKYKKPWVNTICRGKHKQYKMVEQQLYCHIYEDVTAIAPIPWIGTQRWKKVGDEVKKAVNLRDLLGDDIILNLDYFNNTE